MLHARANGETFVSATMCPLFSGKMIIFGETNLSLAIVKILQAYMVAFSVTSVFVSGTCLLVGVPPIADDSCKK